MPEPSCGSGQFIVIVTIDFKSIIQIHVLIEVNVVAEGLSNPIQKTGQPLLLFSMRGGKARESAAMAIHEFKPRKTRQELKSIRE